MFWYKKTRFMVARGRIIVNGGRWCAYESAGFKTPAHVCTERSSVCENFACCGAFWGVQGAFLLCGVMPHEGKARRAWVRLLYTPMSPKWRR